MDPAIALQHMIPISQQIAEPFVQQMQAMQAAMVQQQAAMAQQQQMITNLLTQVAAVQRPQHQQPPAPAPAPVVVPTSGPVCLTGKCNRILEVMDAGINEIAVDVIHRFDKRLKILMRHRDLVRHFNEGRMNKKLEDEAKTPWQFPDEYCGSAQATSVEAHKT